MNDLENFRAEVKDWLDKNCPSTMRAGAPADTPIDEVWGGRKAVYKLSLIHISEPTRPY